MCGESEEGPSKAGDCVSRAVEAALAPVKQCPPAPLPGLLTLQQGPRDVLAKFHLPGLIAAAGAGGTQAPLNQIALRRRAGGLPVHPEAVRVSGCGLESGEWWAWRQSGMKVRRTQAPEPEAWVQILALLPPGWDTLGRSTSEPQLPHL